MGHTAALVVARVAGIDVPRAEWPELISSLLANMAPSAAPPNSSLRQATLEALGYTCEELGALDEDYLQQDQVNSLLTAVVQGMRKDEPDAEVRHAATVALCNALEFAHSNFGNEAERNYIMQSVCEGTLAGARAALWTLRLLLLWVLGAAPKQRNCITCRALCGRHAVGRAHCVVDAVGAWVRLRGRAGGCALHWPLATLPCRCGRSPQGCQPVLWVLPRKQRCGRCWTGENRKWYWDRKVMSG